MSCALHSLDRNPSCWYQYSLVGCHMERQRLTLWIITLGTSLLIGACGFLLPAYAVCFFIVNLIKMNCRKLNKSAENNNSETHNVAA